MKTTRYVSTSVLTCRPYPRREWIASVLAHPLRTEVQANGRIRRWALIPDVGKYLRVDTEADGETVHNAFFDRRFKPRNAGGCETVVVQYQADTDMLYIKLADGASTESGEVAPGIVLDFDERNRVIGVEIEDASSFTDLSRLEVVALPIANLIINERMPAKV